MEGYLGKLEPLKDRLVDAIGRDEDIKELKREYQEILRFKQYVDFLRQGEKSDFWKQMYNKTTANGLTSEDTDAITRSMR